VEKIKIERKHYDELVNELQGYQLQLREVVAAQSETISAESRGRSSEQFADYERKIEGIMSSIRMVKDIISKCEIIERVNADESVVNINDLVTVDFGDDEPETYKLIAGLADSRSGEVSINSPMGGAIYLQRVGQKCSYKVGNNLISVLIVSKKSLEKSEDSSERA